MNSVQSGVHYHSLISSNGVRTIRVSRCPQSGTSSNTHSLTFWGKAPQNDKLANSVGIKFFLFEIGAILLCLIKNHTVRVG